MDRVVTQVGLFLNTLNLIKIEEVYSVQVVEGYVVRGRTTLTSHDSGTLHSEESLDTWTAQVAVSRLRTRTTTDDTQSRHLVKIPSQGTLR